MSLVLFAVFRLPFAFYFRWPLFHPLEKIKE
jgi:hypothetical protein